MSVDPKNKYELDEMWTTARGKIGCSHPYIIAEKEIGEEVLNNLLNLCADEKSKNDDPGNK
jgi:Zn-finger protein